MAVHHIIMEREIPHGLALNYLAPYSGQLDDGIVSKALAKIPGAIEEAREIFGAINEVRSSGLAPIFDEGPLDDAVRDGAWQPHLQVTMPTAGGLPGSRGMKVAWRYRQGAEDYKVGISRSVKS